MPSDPNRGPKAPSAHQRPARSDAPGRCQADDCGCHVDRRTFIKLAGSTAAGVSAAAASPARVVAGPFKPSDTEDHFVPADKKLDAQWVRALTAKGQPEVFSGDDLNTIAMPIGGICTGQLYLTGDGRLAHWDLFNQVHFSGYGADNYEAGKMPQSPLRQGAAVEIRASGKTLRRRLDRTGFPGVRFRGEYPIGIVEYLDPALPVSIRLEAFSPFIPLNAPDSGLPATVLRYRVKNTSSAPCEVTLAGWLENGCSLESAKVMFGKRVNRRLRRDGLTMIAGSAEADPSPPPEREPIVLADFEGQDYGRWTVEGEAFGDKPAGGTLPGQQEVSGFEGEGLVNTFINRDEPHGKLTSPEFTIDRRWICFLIGGGRHTGETCINLLVDDKVVRTATGLNREKLRPHNWNVQELVGKKARLEIVDAHSDGWGHINIDQIELRDRPRNTRTGPLEDQEDFGTMGLAVLGEADRVVASLSLADEQLAADKLPDALFAGEASENGAAAKSAEKPFDQRLIGAAGKTLELQPGQEGEVVLVVAWCFPNRPEHGNFYGTRFDDAAAVASHVQENYSRLVDDTYLWRDTWYDATLPWWLLDRLFSTVSTLATNTCQWWDNGRFWAYEGVCCCHGTCTHVWNYEHAMARLFPELERSARTMQDYGAGFDEETGMVRFRGEGWDRWAGDGQAGTVLKAYREHQLTPDGTFLRQFWPKIKRSLQFLIEKDQNADGLIESSQHNTYDIDFYGPNTMVGSLYLAALQAARAMAGEVGDEEFAETCRKIYQSGRELTCENLYDGEYFFQEVDLEAHPKAQYGRGCLSDQLFGQGWAHQVGLPHIYPPEMVRSALAAIWKYNWTPDVGPQNQAHAPLRWFARPGEAGLFTCTWPKSPHMEDGVRYKNEVWTGIEYQVAGNMVWDGMVTEPLAICRAIHERYHPSKRNPWNEVECGDHYARAMASHGVFLALCGFEYHGPKQHVGMAPRLGSDDFRAAFTAAEGWGTLWQQRDDGSQQSGFEVRWGKLPVKTVAVELPDGKIVESADVRLEGKSVTTEMSADGSRVLFECIEPITVEKGQRLELDLRFA
jgi:uncharacterized protein (DUF608 family)